MAKRNRKARKAQTQVTPVAPTPTAPTFTMDQVLDLISRAAGITHPAVASAPLVNGAQTETANVGPIGRTGPRRAYSVVANPQPPFGETTTQVYQWLKGHSPASQKDLEAGTKLTEGQIKGALRQLVLAGYVAGEKAERQV